MKTACFCQSHGRLVAAHVRDDADNVFGAVEELVSIGRQLDLPVQVSHVGSMGGFGQMERLLALIDRYRASGMELSGDCYPYDAFSTRIGIFGALLHTVFCDRNLRGYVQGTTMHGEIVS